MDTVLWASLVVGSVLPLLVGLVTKASWSSAVKAYLLAALSAVTGFVGAYVSLGSEFDAEAGAVNALATFIAAISVHYGFWKPVGATEVVQNTLVKG